MAQQLGKIGFVGLGLMGQPMARNLLEAGGDVCVFNRSAAKAAPLLALGATGASDIAELATSVRGGVIILCVSDTPAMRACIEALCTGDLSGTLVIDMGTSEVAVTREVAARITGLGGAFIDAPVSGGAVGAQAGTLSIMAGGDTADIARARGIFEVLGAAHTHIGPVGAGQVAKAANQAIVGATLSIVAEAMLLAKTAGADVTKMREALLGGFAQSRILDLHGQRMIERAFEPGGRASTQAKDLRQAVGLAQSVGLSLPALEQNCDLWDKMESAGLGDLDQSGYLAFLETLQGK
jgi:3-hydroxyisobutyrate dehydrogenase-like beta-hydroxyacid dehydrogenase